MWIVPSKVKREFSNSFHNTRIRSPRSYRICCQSCWSQSLSSDGPKELCCLPSTAQSNEWAAVSGIKQRFIQPGCTGKRNRDVQCLPWKVQVQIQSMYLSSLGRSVARHIINLSTPVSPMGWSDKFSDLREITSWETSSHSGWHQAQSSPFLPGGCKQRWLHSVKKDV